jgi:hypothetical protein
MGDFRIVIEAVGGHGCNRTAKEGEGLGPPCVDAGCPDCAARAFVAELKAKGCSVQRATLTHWPIHSDGQGEIARSKPRDIVDDVLAAKRIRNSFSE